MTLGAVAACYSEVFGLREIVCEVWGNVFVQPGRERLRGVRECLCAVGECLRAARGCLCAVGEGLRAARGCLWGVREYLRTL